MYYYFKFFYLKKLVKALKLQYWACFNSRLNISVLGEWLILATVLYPVLIKNILSHRRDWSSGRSSLGSCQSGNDLFTKKCRTESQAEGDISECQPAVGTRLKMLPVHFFFLLWICFFFFFSHLNWTTLALIYIWLLVYIFCPSLLVFGHFLYHK